MKSLFESLFTTKDIIRKKYPGGWVGWVNDNMSDEDDGRLTRFTTMDGRHMYSKVQHLVKNGFMPPELVKGTYYFKDYFLDVMEYNYISDEKLDKYSFSLPKWLNVKEPMIRTHSLEEIMTMNIDPQKHNVMRCSYFYNHQLDKE